MYKLKKHIWTSLVEYLGFLLFPSKIQKADLSQQMVRDLFKEEIILLYVHLRDMPSTASLLSIISRIPFRENASREYSRSTNDVRVSSSFTVAKTSLAYFAGPY